MISPRLALWSIGYGLLIWIEATITIRFAGDLVFPADNTPWMIGVFAVTSVIVFIVGWVFFMTFQTKPVERAATAILICAAGLVGSSLILVDIHAWLPDMPQSAHRWYAAWVAWSYGVGLIAGLWPLRLPRVPQ